MYLFVLGYWDSMVGQGGVCKQCQCFGIERTELDHVLYDRNAATELLQLSLQIGKSTRHGFFEGGRLLGRGWDPRPVGCAT